MPMLARLRTTIVHSTQMLNPMCSAKIEKIRFLRAMRLPVLSQNASFSGSQCSIQRPLVRLTRCRPRPWPVRLQCP